MMESKLQWVCQIVSYQSFLFLLSNTVIILSEYSLKIVWHYDAELNNEIGEEIVFATIDGTHCKILEPRKHPSKGWFSYKQGGPAFAYEICTAIYHQKIIWVNGPFRPGEYNDILMARAQNGILTMIPDGKKVMGDNGYHGESEKITTPNRHDSELVKRKKGRAMARQETINRRIKSYGVIKGPFRSDPSNHQMVFEAVCVLVQYDLENGSLLYEV
jgi:DDE superfamily endonuclease